MIVEQQPESAENDCFVDISGELCLFELKDGEFSLDDAVLARRQAGKAQARAHHGDHHVVRRWRRAGALRRPSRRMRQEPAAERRNAIAYLEGIDGIVVDLGSLIESIYASHSVDLLRHCLPFVTLDAASLVRALRAPEQTRSIQSCRRECAWPTAARPGGRYTAVAFKATRRGRRRLGPPRRLVTPRRDRGTPGNARPGTAKVEDGHDSSDRRGRAAPSGARPARPRPTRLPERPSNRTRATLRDCARVGVWRVVRCSVRARL